MTWWERRTETRRLRKELLRAFPSTAHAAALPALKLVRPSGSTARGLIQGTWPAITFGGETLEVPGRIAVAFPRHRLEELAPLNRAAAGCIYTRHHDGFIRQRALHLALSQDVDWSAPFLVQLLGEYVVEISTDVHEFLTGAAATHPTTVRGLQHFVEANPSFMELTRARATSYWREYYCRRYWPMQDYPAIRALDQLEHGLG